MIKITPVEGGSVSVGDRVFWERRLSRWERLKHWLQDPFSTPPTIVVEDAIVTASTDGDEAAK